ncbi:MAG: hypothetical protein EP318_02150 [Rhodobacteraceae bacterium]|nr:MAG: hypothetical protein EP318_02150 [Paracoccaceae bacterium]
MSLADRTLSQLLELSVDINEELRRRNVVRSANSPTGGLAEYLFVEAFGWEQANNSQKSYDARAGPTRYQIKGRRVHRRTKSRQMSAIRDPDGFEFLAAVLFDDRYQVTLAALIPADVVRARSTYIAHTNSYRFNFTDTVLSEPGVRDVTARLQAVLAR